MVTDGVTIGQTEWSQIPLMNSVDDSNQIIDKKAKYFYKKLMEIKIEKSISLQRWNFILNREDEHIVTPTATTREITLVSHTQLNLQRSETYTQPIA